MFYTFEKKVALSAFVLVLTVGHLLAQKQITGKVVDAKSRKPIANATVCVVGDDENIITNALGYFQMALDSLVTIKVTAQGYEPGYVTLTDFANIQIGLVPYSRPFENLPFTVDPEIVAVSRTILKELGASNASAFLHYPYPWERQVKEEDNLKKNKVKLIRSENFMHQYDKHGLPVHEEYYKDTDFGFQQASKGIAVSTTRNAYGHELTTKVSWPGDTTLRWYFYSGDTVFMAKYSHMMGYVAARFVSTVLVVYGNMQVIYDYSRRDFDLISYKVTPKNDGYLIEFLRQHLDKKDKVVLDLTIRMDKDYLIKEILSDRVKRRFSYNEFGLLTNVQVYDGDQAVTAISFKRNERGLVTEHRIAHYSRGNRKLTSSETLRYQYEYDD